MNGDLISQTLQEQGLSFAILSKAIGVSLSHVYNVAYRNTTSLTVAKKIACALDKPFLEVFPEYERKVQERDIKAQKISSLSQKLSHV